MKTAQKLFSLRHSEIFESFNAVELGRLLGILEELELPKHHVIFSPGVPSDAIYFIEKGRVRLTKLSAEGKTVILALLGPGDLIGEAAWKPESMTATLKRWKSRESIRSAAKLFMASSARILNSVCD